MATIVESLKDVPILSYRKGETILTQGNKSEKLYFLFDGIVEIARNDVQVAVISDKGAVFGEISILLDIHHTATVRCLADSRFYVIDDPKTFIQTHGEVVWYTSQVLASRLFNLTEYVVNELRDKVGTENKGVVSNAFEKLFNQQSSAVETD